MTMRRRFQLLLAFSAGAFVLTSLPKMTIAAPNCGFGWAKPGKYRISGNFRGQVESTSAQLTRDCRVSLQIPGVFTGGRVKRSGKCLSFALKVEGQGKALSAKWCNNYGMVPWNGKVIRASISAVQIDGPKTKVKTNFRN
ncbi:MAG: hypothetical protein WBD37_04735 [Anderseniella sp.]